LFGYSLGKAQRILAELEPYAKKPVLVYSTISPFNECYLQEGVRLAVTENLEEKIKLLKEKEDLAGELIIAPPSILTSKFTYQLGDYVTAFASGWMQSKNKRHGTNRYDHGFIMSDHADWNDLNQTIKDCGAKKIYVQHRNGVLVRHLRKEGFEAYPVEDLDLDKYIGVGTNLSFL
jgi:putative mRNA 3-end processing factor